MADLVSESDADNAKRVIILLEIFLKLIEGFVGDVCLGLFGHFHLFCKINDILINMIIT